MDKVTVDELRKVVGRNVRVRRQELGMSQEELAAAAGCRQSWLSRLERGTVGFSDDSLARLADGLRTQPSILLAAESFSLVSA